MPSPYTTPYSLQALTADRAEDFWRVTDSVARERRYLSFLEISQPLSAQYVARQLAANAPHLLLLYGDQVVGWCDVSPHEWPIHRHRGTLGMGMLPAHRGLGLGGWLLEQTLALAAKRGFHRVELTVHADNRRAIQLYRRHGFQQEGHLRDAIHIDGRFGDALLMARIN
ncbi:GNAT family N-acetyltransferase [Chromobacterium sinusclupearum]|jgi:RimJ/RimL family protein N-acetyltransferase|uniref:GNAT family N-acetyltransferase n=1 Tax=Chromobacterium sinusclupearum TaxID=2077146 RepID=A0A2K4MPH5_9NEIS|nr:MULTISPECIES: GNAT family protein [Chromobacterium]POA99006.1 GNAT family N-acetyltransferase [Chromobacterium sinusclupearum]